MGLQVFFPISFWRQPTEVFCGGGCSWGVLQDLCQSSCVGVSFLIKLQAWACDFDEGETLTLLQDFWGCMFYRTPLENCFYFSLKRIENAFSNFLLIISFLLIQTICKSLWTHHIGFKWGFYTLCLLFWQLMELVRSWLKSHIEWNQLETL